MANINTKAYWDSRFGTGDWAQKGGFSQTMQFAQSQLPLLQIPNTFTGTICDFGCGAGDAFPIYKKYFPNANLVGVDFSQSAIDLCIQRYGDMAQFICGDEFSVPVCDIIISSNVFEHLDNDKEIAFNLSKKARDFYIFVPYRENIVNNIEHINTYDLTSFNFLPNLKTCIFKSNGWTLEGMQLIWQIYIKNIARLMLGKPLRENGLQIMYHSKSSISL